MADRTLNELIAELASTYLPRPITRERIGYAAVTLTHWLCRNSGIIEDRMHAGDGPWTDEDMFRRNTLATSEVFNALLDLIDMGDTGVVEDRFITDEAEQDDVIDALVDLAYRLTTDLPDELVAPFVAAAQPAILEFVNLAELAGLDLMLDVYERRLAWFGSHWWLAPDFDRIVEQYVGLGVPDPDGDFVERMRDAPWTVTDAQAKFVCNRRYDVGPGTAAWSPT